MPHAEEAGNGLDRLEMTPERRSALDSLKAAHDHALQVGDGREADLDWIFERALASTLPDEDILAVAQDVSRGRLHRAIERLR